MPLGGLLGRPCAWIGACMRVLLRCLSVAACLLKTWLCLLSLLLLLLIDVRVDRRPIPSRLLLLLLLLLLLIAAWLLCTLPLLVLGIRPALLRFTASMRLPSPGA